MPLRETRGSSLSWSWYQQSGSDQRAQTVVWAASRGQLRPATAFTKAAEHPLPRLCVQAPHTITHLTTMECVLWEQQWAWTAAAKQLGSLFGHGSLHCIACIPNRLELPGCRHSRNQKWGRPSWTSAKTLQTS